MGKRVGTPERRDVDPHRAAWDLCSLSAWTDWPLITRGGELAHPGEPDTPARRELRALRSRDEPLPALDALAEALDALDRLGETGDFEAWRERHPGVAGVWRTLDLRDRALRAA